MRQVREIPVSSGSGGYVVRIARGSMVDLPRLLGEFAPARRYALISDTTVAALHGKRTLAGLVRAGLDAHLLDFPEGEASKSRECWADLTDRMLEGAFDRDTVVVALGGGVTGDLAGFVAATYMRGVPVVQVPTSVVAMVDSSVGGKTGVDVPGGKNLVGAFHPPRIVVVDPEFVRTLPRPERARGLAEAAKHGAIRDRAHLDEVASAAPALLEGDPEALERVVATSVELKARVVSEDEREGGVRRTLNFGHTLAHALEAVTRFALSHGEAVAVGMVLESRLGERMGVTEEGTAGALAGILERLELPTRIPGGVDPEEVLRATRTDKKAAGGAVRYALLERLGQADRAGGGWARPASDEVVLDILREG